jgi:CDP-paratose 2-epimerase
MPKLLITGICGFVGRTLAEALLAQAEPNALSIIGIDNFSRAGSWSNREPLLKKGVQVLHGDLRLASDLEAIGPVDWVLDCAANPSVMAGVDGTVSSRQLMEHNLVSTINLLEVCRQYCAGFILLSTSRVYSIAPLARLKFQVQSEAFTPLPDQAWPAGLSSAGVSETYSTAAPLSLYGASKLASETLALEYGFAFDFPVWINRCGVLVGAGQFGKSDQRIFRSEVRELAGSAQEAYKTSMLELAEIQAAVEQLSEAKRYELTKWLIEQMPLPELNEDVTDAIALERFQALDAEEEGHAEGPAK